MEENEKRGVALKTYSRTRNRDRKNEAVFVEKALESLKQSVFSPDDKIQARNKVERKRQRSKNNISGQGTLKKLKQGKRKKAIMQVMIQRKPSCDTQSLEHNTSENDVLFGEDLQPVKRRKKSTARTIKAKQQQQQGKRCMTKDARVKDRNKISASSEQRENGSVRQSPPVQEPVVVSKKTGKPPLEKIGSQDKVSDWLARSDRCTSPQLHDDSSKEIWRQEQFTGDEMRNKLFPDEFFKNLNQVLKKPEIHQAKTSKFDQG